MKNQKKNVIVLVVTIIIDWVFCMDIDNGGGNIIQNLPCVVRLNQLSCSSSGANYPDSAINTFIIDNKALLRRMFGELQEPKTFTTTTVTLVQTVLPSNGYAVSGPLIKPQFASPPTSGQFSTVTRFRRNIGNDTVENEEQERPKRQATFPGDPTEDKNKEDVCESATEIVSPKWASNSNGKVRAIVNNDQFEQAVHQEICKQASTARCSRDCRCEQKFKWHRMLAYDPNNDCAGIFMDWFLFPSCCVCRCNKNPFLGK